MQATNPAQATQLLQERVRAAEPMRQCIGRAVGINRCMFVGRHWITPEMMAGYINTTGLHLTNFNPDTTKLRLTLNRIPRFIHETAAATFPDKMAFGTSPPQLDTGAEASFRAHVLGTALDSAISSSGFLAAARDANFRRCIDGMHGIGLSVKREKRQIRGGKGEYTEGDAVVSAFAFDPHRLVLDPGNQSLDLWDHEYVIYRDVWTVTKIKRVLGIELDENNLKTVGQLMPYEMAMNAVSLGRLYSFLKEYSTTKGAFVVHVHEKGENGLFPTMLIGIDKGAGGGSEDIEWQNFEDQESPFGGNGLPFMLLHGYREPDSMISKSDVALLTDDQNQINLLKTMSARILQKHSGFQWLVPEGSMPGDGIDDAKSYFNNYVGGLIPYKAMSGGKPLAPPQLVQTPAPTPYLEEAITMHQERDMPAQIHRPPITAGATKTHVPDSSFQAALQQAGQVLGTRVREDAERYETMARVILGTCVKLAKAGSPTALANLRRDGFDQTDFAVLSEADPAYPACEIRLLESSIKYRSTEQKEDRLNTAAQLQMIDAVNYRTAIADLDAPLTEEDGTYSAQAKKWAVRVLLGEEWIPRSLGDGTTFFVKAFRLATLDRRADPAAIQRLELATQSMLAYANMETQQATAAQNPPAPQAAAQPAQEQAQPMPQTASISDLITALNGPGGGGSSAQPVAA